MAGCVDADLDTRDSNKLCKDLREQKMGKGESRCCEDDVSGAAAASELESVGKCTGWHHPRKREA
jgi:hypothetical protein